MQDHRTGARGNFKGADLLDVGSSAVTLLDDVIVEVTVTLTVEPKP